MKEFKNLLEMLYNPSSQEILTLSIKRFFYIVENLSRPKKFIIKKYGKLNQYLNFIKNEFQSFFELYEYLLNSRSIAKISYNNYMILCLCCMKFLHKIFSIIHNVSKRKIKTYRICKYKIRENVSNLKNIIILYCKYVESLMIGLLRIKCHTEKDQISKEKFIKLNKINNSIEKSFT